MKKERFEGTPVFESYPGSEEIKRKLKNLRFWDATLSIGLWLGIPAWCGAAVFYMAENIAHLGYLILGGGILLALMMIGATSTSNKLQTLVGEITNQLFQLQYELGMETDAFYKAERVSLAFHGSILLKERKEALGVFTHQAQSNSFDSLPADLGKVATNATQREMALRQGRFDKLYQSLVLFNLQPLGSGYMD